MELVSIEGFPDYLVDKLGNVYSTKREGFKKLKPSLVDPGYYIVLLSNGSKQVKFYIHRLIALNFIPNPNNLDTVNHINGIKTDNSIENLEWLSRADNIRHSFTAGLQPKREQRPYTKINNTDLINLYKDGHSGKYSIRELSVKYNLSKGYVGDLSRGLYNKELGLKPFNHITNALLGSI